MGQETKEQLTEYLVSVRASKKLQARTLTEAQHLVARELEANGYSMSIVASRPTDPKVAKPYYDL